MAGAVASVMKSFRKSAASLAPCGGRRYRACLRPCRRFRCLVFGAHMSALVADVAERPRRRDRLGVEPHLDDGRLAALLRTLEGRGEVGGPLDRLAMAAIGARKG